MPADRTILFADVSNSTGIFEALGDVASRRYISEVLDELSAITERTGGTVVKTIGDEIMSSFALPLDAATAAIDMQRFVSSRPPIGRIPSAIRVGFDSGEVVIEGGDVFGDVVNVAARVVGMAAADQILTTGRSMERMGGGVAHRSLGLHGVRGRDGQLQLIEILWRGETAQMTIVAPRLSQMPTPEMELRVGDQSLDLKVGSPKKTIGRGAECDLVVPAPSASRAHADIVCRGALFYLEDHSTNGTYVQPDGGQQIFVHRGHALLQGSGVIRLGEPTQQGADLDIRYRTLYST